jgi:ergothioneine biosynthesis protein EgtB
MSGTSLTTMIRLRAVQNKSRELFEGMNDTNYRLQFHKDLSALGWHLGHGFFIENYWLHEIIQGNDSLTQNSSQLFIPENCPKPERGPKLPKLKDLLSEMVRQQDINDLLLLEMTPPLSDHPLFKDEYIQNFIIQHYAQHYESMKMAFNQIAIKNDKGKYIPEAILTSCSLSKVKVSIAENEFTVGGELPYSYDNELPQHKIKLEAFNIAAHPVTNAEYLRFMEEGGYESEELWSKDGWLWRQKNKIHHPEHWAKNNYGQWYGIKQQGPFDLKASDSVYGLCFYEADAFAKWAQARLPHEHEWEAGVRSEKLHNTGKVWEWCGNTLFPYEGFKAFPYDEYSSPWFDGKHYVLRGASHHTRPDIRRASFRNFFNADKRHIFAGLRLVF